MDRPVEEDPKCAVCENDCIRHAPAFLSIAQLVWDFPERQIIACPKERITTAIMNKFLHTLDSWKHVQDTNLIRFLEGIGLRPGGEPILVVPECKFVLIPWRPRNPNADRWLLLAVCLPGFFRKRPAPRCFVFDTIIADQEITWDQECEEEAQEVMARVLIAYGVGDAGDQEYDLRRVVWRIRHGRRGGDVSVAETGVIFTVMLVLEDRGEWLRRVPGPQDLPLWTPFTVRRRLLGWKGEIHRGCQLPLFPPTGKTLLSIKQTKQPLR